MKNILFALLTLALVACSNAPENEAYSEKMDAENVVEDMASNVFGMYGEEIDVSEAVTPMDVMLEMAGRDSMAFTVSAEINACCKKKGCWMNVDAGNGEEMKVTFKDYGFFVPKEGVEGKTAVMRGVAFWDTLSVETLRHYAEDDGASAEEIEEITEPELSMMFVADGVVIENE